MSCREIIDRIITYDCSLVEITGGEPLFQKNTPGLIEQILENRFDVLLETNGSYDIGNIDDRCVKIVDIKCPGSGEEKNNFLGNIEKLTPKDQIKFVIGDREDYDFSKNMLHRIAGKIPPDHILYSPVYGKVHPADLADWILKDCLNVRLNLQLHKIIWPNIERGV